MLGSLRTVHVTTKDQLVSALATADQVTVEGDEELLTYAIRATTAPEYIKPGRGPRRLFLLIAGVLLLGLSLAAAVYLLTLGNNIPTSYSGPLDAEVTGPSLAPAPQPSPETAEGPKHPRIQRPNAGFDLVPFAWPLVAVVAIIALFMIARQAIASGSNVTVSLQVTERISGRVVITKVRDRAPPKQPA
jgi:hypothetical protein